MASTRREFLSLAIGLSVVPLLAACGAPPAPPAATAAPAAAKPAAPATPVSSSATQGAALFPNPQPPAPSTSPPKYGGTFVAPTYGDPLFGGDTMFGALSVTFTSTYPVNGDGSLVKQARDDVYKIAPHLAESWENNATFTEWVFKIRDGVKWHDGTAFTAQDAAWWLNLAVFGTKTGDKIRPPATWGRVLGDVDTVDTPDATHVRIRVKGPEPLLPLNLATQQVAHPRHLMQPRIDQGEVMVTPSDVGWVSTGPFKVTQYDKGSRIQYKRHDGYWEKDAQGNKLPYLDGISMPYVRDANAMDNAFIGSQIDAGIRNSNFALSKTRLDTYRKNLGTEKFYLAQIGFNPYGLHFNVLKSGPFQDVRVRKAVAMWIDQAGMTEVLGGFAQAETFLRPTNPFNDPEFLQWPGWNVATRDADRAAARQLLADAGFASGFEATILSQQNWQPWATYYQGQLSDLGIRASLDLKDAGTYTQLTATKDPQWELKVSGIGAVTHPWLLKDTLNAVSRGGIGMAHNDARVIDLFDQMKAVLPDEGRIKAIYSQIQRHMILDQPYVVPTFSQLYEIPYRSYVQGVVPPAENTYHNLDFATVWLDK
jgi:peptide/nickel transport system substrate-binding protein